MCKRRSVLGENAHPARAGTTVQSAFRDVVAGNCRTRRALLLFWCHLLVRAYRNVPRQQEKGRKRERTVWVAGAGCIRSLHLYQAIGFGKL